MPQPTSEDRNKLVQFLTEFYKLIDELLSNGRDRQDRTIISSEALPLLRAAWSELKEQCPLESAAAVIRATRSDRLVWAGLYGAQLKLKLWTIDRLRTSFFSFGGTKWIKKLLDAIDRLLDSLIAATGLDEALKELKDILSDNVDED